MVDPRCQALQERRTSLPQPRRCLCNPGWWVTMEKRRSSVARTFRWLKSCSQAPDFQMLAAVQHIVQCCVQTEANRSAGWIQSAGQPPSGSVVGADFYLTSEARGVRRWLSAHTYPHSLSAQIVPVLNESSLRTPQHWDT